MRSISPWIEKHVNLIPKDQAVIDVACGNGRHSLFFLEQGYEVIAVDIDTSVIAGNEGRSVGAIVVVNYLWRPLFSHLRETLKPGGILLYDTFAQGNEKYGRPRNPDFLLMPGELSEQLSQNFDIIDSFDGYIENPVPACRQSIAARKRT